MKNINDQDAFKLYSSGALLEELYDITDQLFNYDVISNLIKINTDLMLDYKNTVENPEDGYIGDMSMCDYMAHVMSMNLFLTKLYDCWETIKGYKDRFEQNETNK